MNWGAFAGGAAKGIEQGLDMVRKKKRMDRQAIDEARQDEEYEKQKAMEAEITALYAPKEELPETPTPLAPTVKNPAAGGIGIMRPEPAGQPAPQVARNPAMSGIMSKALTAAPAQPKVQEAPKDSVFEALNRAGQIIDIKAKYGNADPLDQVKLIQMRKTMEQEGLRDSYLAIQNGDLEGGLAYFNSTGNSTGWKWKGAPAQQEVTLPGGIKMPSVVGTLVNDKGEERTINTAQGLFGMMNFDNRMDSIMKGDMLKADTQYKNDSLGIERTKAANEKAHYERSDANDSAKMKAIQSGIARGMKQVLNPETGELEWRLLGPGETAETGKMSDRQKMTLTDLGQRREVLAKALEDPMLSPEQRETVRGKIEAINGRIDGMLGNAAPPPPADDAPPPPRFKPGAKIKQGGQIFLVDDNGVPQLQSAPGAKKESGASPLPPQNPKPAAGPAGGIPADNRTLAMKAGELVGKAGKMKVDPFEVIGRTASSAAEVAVPETIDHVKGLADNTKKDMKAILSTGKVTVGQLAEFIERKTRDHNRSLDEIMADFVAGYRQGSK